MPDNKRHLFLTGDIQIGKSTVISAVLKQIPVNYGGFRTAGINYLPDGSSDICLYPADKTADSGKIAAHRGSAGITVFPEIFDGFGSTCLLRSCGLVVMDELGFMESSAFVFQRTVLQILNGTVPVLGVVRNRRTPFLDTVRAHPAVDVLTVTRENREILPDILVTRLMSW